MTIYNQGKALNRDWTTGTWRVMLLTSAYSPNIDQDFVSDIVGNEVSTSGTGYSRQTLTGQAVVVDDTNDRVDHNANNTSWAALTCSFRYAVIYKFGTVDGDSVLHSYIDLGAQSLTALPFTIQWNGGASAGTVFRGT